MTELPPPRPCRWPDGGCGQPVIDVITKAGRKQALDAKPAKVVVIGSLVTTHTPNDGLLIMLEPDPQPEVALVSAVVDGYVDHHATCSAFKQFQERKKGVRNG